MNFKNIQKVQEEKRQKFTFSNEFIDTHIKDIESICDASYAQISMGSLVTIGFVLAHAGIKNTSLYFCDLSDSGTGKTHNFTLQYKLLLQHISKLQESRQVAYNLEDGVKRYHNIHRWKITVAALNQCINTVSAQLLMIDELGLLMNRGGDIIDEVTKLYGVNHTSLSVTKGEIPNSSNIVPVAFSFMGATTLSYFGGTKTVMKEVLGGFINRQMLAYNNQIKLPEEINSIYKDNLDYEKSNKKSLNLFEFAQTCNFDRFEYSEESEKLQLNFKQEVQKLKVFYHSEGMEFGSFYSRIEQNLQIILNILHALYCYEQGCWKRTINAKVTLKGIEYFKRVVFVEFDKLIGYLSDNEKLEREEKQIQKIEEFVKNYYDTNLIMPKIRDVSQKTRLNKEQIIHLTKDFLELVPGTTMLRYCTNYNKELR